MAKKRPNTLPSTYVPSFSRRVQASVLRRLPKISLVELMYVWPKQSATQPHLDPESNNSQEQLNGTVSEYAISLKKDLSKLTKHLIIDKILYDFWPKGLNMLQLSQVDCQLLVDRPNSYLWVLSTVRNSHDKESPIALSPKPFLDKLAIDLGGLFLNYLYVCRHPEYPLVIIRIQVFELRTLTSDKLRDKVHLNSHKPYFIAIPVNSPYIIHSPGDDMVTKIFLQAVERNLPQNPRNPYHIVQESPETITRSLDSMYIRNGSSRFGNALGAWTAYADGIIDVLPLSDGADHQCMIKTSKPTYIDEDKDLVQLKKIANLRFKGTIDGKTKSEKYFDQLSLRQKYKKRRLMYSDIEDTHEDNEEEDTTTQNEYSSITPVNYAEFNIREKMNNSDQRSSITIRLTGSDVFAGLHELSVSTASEEEMVLNPRMLPSWLTGEERNNYLVIEDGNVKL